MHPPQVYIERLKQSVAELSAARDKELMQQQLKARQASEEEQRLRSILHRVFEFRVSRVTDKAKWGAILSEDFVMCLPITP